jgi:protease-4
MAEKKHPILIVLAILLGVGLFLGTVMIIVLKVLSPASTLSFSDKIGVVPIEGTILDSQTITTQLVEFKKDKGIKAVILRINSPGGAVGPTQEIHREVQRTAETKEIVASLGGVAASGGYYIATAAKKIVANPGTITGSIGVLMEFVRFEELLRKIGVKLEVIKSGEFKDIGSPHRELTAREKELINTLIEDIQKQFVNAVASGRNLSLEKTNEIADGRIFSGVRAKELGLVDDLGNFQDAVEIAKNISGIRGDVTLVYPKKSKLELWDLLLDRVAGSVARLIRGMKTTFEYRWGGLQLHHISERY